MANPDGAKPRKEEGNMAMTLSSVGIRNDQEYSSDAEGQNYDENAMLATNDKKKSCFQITSVKASETGQNDDIDSNDDMDESRAEDFSSSELLDVSKASTQTDLDRLDLGENSHSTPIKKVTANNFPPSNSSIVNLGNQAIPRNGDQKQRTGNEPPHELKHQLSDSGKQTTNGTHKASNGNPASRFKVVKVPRIEPFTRGRWRCRDFEAQAPTTQSSDVNRTEQNKDLQHSGDSSAASSVHYVPGENNPADNPFGGDTTSEQYGNINSISTRLGVYKTKLNNDKHHISPMDQQGSLEHHIKETLNIDHSSGPTEDTALSSEDGDGTSAGGAIDNKIEQAMDLVKSHLLFAVREEVEVLKVQIKELGDKNEQLQRENAMLRQNHNAPQANQPQGAQMGIQQQTLPQQQPTPHPHQQQYTTTGGAQGQTQQGQSLPPPQGQLQGIAPHPQGIPQQQPTAQLSMSVPSQQQQQPQHLQQTSQSIPMQQHSIPGAQQTGALQHAPSQQAVQHSQPPPKS